MLNATEAYISRRGQSRAQLEAVWRERLGRQATSGQSIAEFCRREGITAASFYMWRSRHRSRAAAAVGKAAASRLPASFIDVGTMVGRHGAADAIAGAPVGRIELRLDLGCGMVLHLVRQ